MLSSNALKLPRAGVNSNVMGNAMRKANTNSHANAMIISPNFSLDHLLFELRVETPECFVVSVLLRLARVVGLFEGGPNVAGVCNWVYEQHHFMVEFHEPWVLHRSVV